MYGKLFAQMYDGTLATKGPWQALVTFQQLVILADPEGVVDMTAESLARRTTIPFEIIEAGIRALEMPDPASRTPAEEGRRIVRLSDTRAWGWRIVNYGFYRNIRNEIERRNKRREYHKEYARQRRQQAVNKSQQNEHSSNGVNGVTLSSKKKKETTTTSAKAEYAFMGSMRSVWKAAYGGSIPSGSAKLLKQPVSELGEEEVARRLAVYCNATEGQYASIPRFANTIGTWAEGKRNGSDPALEQFRKRGYLL